MQQEQEQMQQPIALPSWATRRRRPAHSPAGELPGGGAVAVMSALEYGPTRSGRYREPRAAATGGGVGHSSLDNPSHSW